MGDRLKRDQSWRVALRIRALRRRSELPMRSMMSARAIALISSAVLIASGLAWSTSSAAAQSCAPGETSLSYGFTGGMQSAVIPAGVSSATVYLSGAQGGDGKGGAGTIGGSPSSPGGSGGLGGRVSGTLSVSPGDVLTIGVGGRASLAVNPGGAHGGGSGGGNGGGATDIQVGGSRAAVAGGGGGGGNAGWSTADQVAGGAGGNSGGAGSGGASVPGGPGPFGGSGGTSGAGGAGGGGCSGFPATAGGATGQGGASFNFSGSFQGAGYGGGGGGGATAGGGGGGAGVGTTFCQQNWNGGGGGGAGGTSSAGSLQSAVVTEGVNTGDGSALICFAAPEFTVSGTASGQTGTVGLQLTSSAGNQTANVTAGSASFAFADGLPDGASWSVDVAAAPNGQLCTVSPQAGVISGADVSLTLSCTTVTVEIAPTTVPNGTVGAAYSLALAASSANGGTAPYTFLIASGALPPGLALSGAGQLSGTPTAAGTFNFTARATASNGFTGTRAYTVVVDAPTITLQPGVLPDGMGGAAYGPVALSAEGGTAPYTFAVTGGALPPGLALGGAGQLSGTPTAAGTFNVTVAATDANGFTGTQDYALVVEEPEITLTPETLPAGSAGISYGPVALTADGGTAPYTFAVTTGQLPEGLTLDTDGMLSGTPAEVGSFAVAVTVTDDNGFTGTRNYTIAVDAPAITIEPDVLAGGTAGSPYGPVTLEASGGVAPYSYAVTGGSLPDGIHLDTNGTLSGTPTEAGSFAITLMATDGNDFTGAHDYTIVVDAPEIALTPDAVPGGKVGDSYGPVIVSADGGTAPYTYEVTDGALPEGLALGANTGEISGTPTEGGSFGATITATDTYGFKGTIAYAVAIEALAPPEAQDHTLDVVAGTSGTLDLTLGATGGPFVSADIVTPPGDESGTARIERVDDSYLLTFAAAGTFAGTAQLTYTLSNADGVSEPATVTVNVIERPDPSLDPEVIGLIRAQTEASKRFAVTQIDNFSSRLEQVRNEGERRNNSFDMRLGYVESTNSLSPDREMEQFVSSLGANGNGDPASMSSPTGPMAYAPADAATEKGQTPAGLAAYGPSNQATGGGQIPTGKSSTGDEAQPSQGQTLYGPDLGRYAIWSSGFINFAESDSGGMDIDATTVGMSGGIDYRFSSRLVAGFGVGYGRDKSDIGENGTESRGNAYSAAIYGSYKLLDNLYIDGILGGSQLDFDSVRYITQTGGYAQGDRSGSQIFGAVTTAYEFRDERWLVSPYGRLRFSRSWLDGFTEQGGGIDNLTYGDQSIDTVSGVLGLRANYTFAMDWGALQPGTRVEYIHDFAGSSRATIGYADIGTLPYLLELEPERDDYATLGFSLDASFNNGMNAGFEYQTSFGNDIQDHAFRLRFGAKF